MYEKNYTYGYHIYNFISAQKMIFLMSVINFVCNY